MLVEVEHGSMDETSCVVGYGYVESADRSLTIGLNEL